MSMWQPNVILPNMKVIRHSRTQVVEATLASRRHSLRRPHIIRPAAVLCGLLVVPPQPQELVPHVTKLRAKTFDGPCGRPNAQLQQCVRRILIARPRAPTTLTPKAATRKLRPPRHHTLGEMPLPCRRCYAPPVIHKRLSVLKHVAEDERDLRGVVGTATATGCPARDVAPCGQGILCYMGRW
jgi:hypothetical protein